MTLKTSGLVLVVLASCLVAAPVQGAAVINIVNADAAGVGFNDPTVVAPVGGNPGTTIGQQRLNVFNQAAAIWGAALDSTVPINVRATWTGLTCSATSAVLGSAGASQVYRDFTLAPFPATWYHVALANRLSQVDNNTDPATGHDINANFNVNLGNPGCLTGTFFYYGFDHNEGTNIDFLATLLHELGHGLGFQTFTSGSTGAYFNSFPAAYDHFLRDDTTGLLWSDPAETNAQRVASAITGLGLSWTGASSNAYGTANMTDSAQLVVTASANGGAADGNYYVGTASFGPALSSPGVTAGMVLAIDDTVPTSDACTGLTNAAAMAGNICVVDRGTCGFTVKAAFCQAAGAVGVVVVDNAAGVPPPPGLGGSDPTITIPAVRVTQTNGTLIKANLPATGNLSTTNVRKSGMNLAGRFLLFAPNPIQGGSSVSHWDTSATPNLLMEPSINPDLNGTLDATLELMRDTGWFAALPVELMGFEIE